jgi:hypothetical protein
VVFINFTKIFWEGTTNAFFMLPNSSFMIILPFDVLFLTQLKQQARRLWQEFHSRWISTIGSRLMQGITFLGSTLSCSHEI